jgi:hypothetical protein
MTITLDNLRWQDRFKIERILGQLKDGVAVAIFLLDGTWKGEAIQESGANQKNRVRYSRSCVLSENRTQDLIGVYCVDENNSLQHLERIILKDLSDYKALALKNVR